MSDVTPGPADNYKSSASYRGARAAVILLGVLLGIAFILLIVGFIVKLSGHKASGEGAPSQFTLAHGAKIISTDVSGNRLILHVRSGAGDEIDIIDTEDGRLVSQVKPQSDIKSK